MIFYWTLGNSEVMSVLYIIEFHTQYVLSGICLLQAVLFLNAGSKCISIAFNNILTAKSGDSSMIF